MSLSRSLACLLAALVLAVSGGAAAAVGPSSTTAPTPAPPPAGYCRAAPPSGWPEIGAATVPDLTPFQDYRAGLAIPAGRAAAGIRIADVEYEWSSSHVELAALELPAAGSSGLDPAFRARDHGTAVLGVLGGSDDGHGITGLAPGATLLPLSPIVSGPGGGYQPDATIAKAAKGLRAGDVLLVELQSLLTQPDGSRILGPIEYYSAVRAAIAAAVKQGIVVVEPAGNGNLDIGGLGPSWLADPADPLASGALIVGAGGAGTGGDAGVADRERVPGSNYGVRVDLQGFGGAVVTSGYADLSGGASADRSYTACFDGTSSASATVAGAVAVLQGAAIAQTGAPLTPARVRELLIDTGLPQVATAADENAPRQDIGPRPQVAAAIAAVGSTQSPPPAVPDVVVPTPVSTVTPPAATPTPAPFIVAAGTRVPRIAVSPSTTVVATRGLSLRFDRPARRLVVTLRDAPAAAVVRRGSRTLRSRHGRIVLSGIRRGHFVLTVSAPGRGGVAYRTVSFRVTVPARGAVRADRV